MRRWLSRLAFTFIVVSLVLMWEIHRGTQQGTLHGTKLGLYIAGAVLCFSFGAAGMKERHRKDDYL
jgi:hypothetical protein